MSDELTARIAEVLAAHTHSYDSDCGEDFGCGGCDFEGDIYTHQAEQVRAVLGETTTEWGRISRSALARGERSILPLRNEDVETWRSRGYAVMSRTVTPWIEVPS